MGHYSCIDDLAFAESRALAFDESRWPSPPPAEANWYLKHVSPGIPMPWWHVLIALLVLVGILAMSRGLLSWISHPITMPTIAFLGGVSTLVGWRRSRPKARELARARWARIAPLVLTRHANAQTRPRWVNFTNNALADRRNRNAHTRVTHHQLANFGRRSLELSPVLLGLGLILAAALLGSSQRSTPHFTLFFFITIVASVFAPRLLYRRVSEKHIMSAIANKRCADCDHDLTGVPDDGFLASLGVTAGPVRCPECGTRYPLVPPARPHEVKYWDRRTRPVATSDVPSGLALQA